VSYVVAAYAITVVTLAVYGAHLQRELRRLRDGRER